MKTLTAVMGRSFRRAWWLGMVGALLSAQSIQAEPSPTQAAGIEERAHGQDAIAQEFIGAPAQMVTKIEVRPEGDEVTVRVKGDGRLFHSARLLEDNRLVVDQVAFGGKKVSIVASMQRAIKTPRQYIAVDMPFAAVVTTITNLL